MEWISVKDRLPESYESVLLYSKELGVSEGAFDAPNIFEQWKYGSIHNVNTVTHWMPLPKPPSNE